MTAALTGIYTHPTAVYADQVTDTPDDGRVVVQARVRRESAARLDEIASTHSGWSRSDALRYLLVLGLQAHDNPPSAARRARTPAPAPDSPRQVQTSPKSEAGRRRDRA
jgi:hypothetical protein